jgi:hypothetical protein
MSATDFLLMVSIASNPAADSLFSNTQVLFSSQKIL